MLHALVEVSNGERALAKSALYERLRLTTNPYKGAVRMEGEQVASMKLFELQSCLSWQFGDGPSTNNGRHLQSRFVRTEQKVADFGVSSFSSNEQISNFPGAIFEYCSGQCAICFNMV